jgi:hypothetical protein
MQKRNICQPLSVERIGKDTVIITIGAPPHSEYMTKQEEKDRERQAGKQILYEHAVVIGTRRTDCIGEAIAAIRLFEGVIPAGNRWSCKGSDLLDGKTLVVCLDANREGIAFLRDTETVGFFFGAAQHYLGRGGIKFKVSWGPDPAGLKRFLKKFNISEKEFRSLESIPGRFEWGTDKKITMCILPSGASGD